jgi:hypothetical protein
VKHQRPEQDMPEDAVVEDLRVVLRADPHALVTDQLEQAVVLKRQPDHE